MRLARRSLLFLNEGNASLARVDDGAIKSNQISFLFVSRDLISLSLSKAVTEGKKEWPALLPSCKRLLNDAKALFAPLLPAAAAATNAVRNV